MQIIECEQGGDLWHQSRAGRITASMFKIARSKVGLLTDQQQAYVDAIRAGKSIAEACVAAEYKKPPTSKTVARAVEGKPIGEPSDDAHDYAFRLAIERISGEPLNEGFETWAMKRGHELEPEARFEHEIETGLTVQRAGFVTSDDGVFGASADGLIGDDGGSEYKCLVSPEGLRNVLLAGDISKFTDQVQGCMWLMNRKWWHFCLYCPALASIGRALTWRRIDRDDAYIDALQADLFEFRGLVDEYESKLRLKAA